MNYLQAYNYLLSLNNVSGRAYLKDPKHCTIYLKRLQKLLDILGNPEKKIPHYIHVAGTSGKGSVCLMLNKILRADRRRVGALTSPSPDGLLGRTEINGRALSKTEFAQIMEKIKDALEIFIKTTDLEIPSQFEILTALALKYFADKKTDWAIMETGLGGRYDSTNVIPRKDIAIITNIGLDHTDVLGNTKTKIAYEKAGIIKPGCAVFTAEKNKIVLKIIQKECQKNKAPLFLVDTKAEPRLNGGICLAAAKYLKISETTARKAIRKTKLPIRMEMVSKKPLIILDGAHNPDKMKTTVKYIKTSKHKYIKTNEPYPHPALPLKGGGVSIPYPFRGETKRGVNRLHLLVGFAANKDITAMIKLLAQLKPKTIACARFTKNFMRPAADPRALKKQFQKLLPQAEIQVFLDPMIALKWSKTRQKTGDLLLVTGSMYLAGELRRFFKS